MFLKKWLKNNNIFCNDIMKREENNIKKELTEEERQQGRYTKYQYKSIHVGNGVWIREDELKRIM